MIRLDQTPRDYAFRFATYPTGDMQQVLEGQAIVTYTVRPDPVRHSLLAFTDSKQEPDGDEHLDGSSERPNLGVDVDKRISNCRHSDARSVHSLTVRWPSTP